MNLIIGFVQLAFALALGTLTYSVEPKGGWILHVAFAFLYSFWITVALVKLVARLKIALHGSRPYQRKEPSQIYRENAEALEHRASSTLEPLQERPTHWVEHDR